MLKKKLTTCFDINTDCKLFITQGFIYQKNNFDIGHFSRGGSDYSAGIIGAAIEAEEVQIWTDVNGVLNNDPRCVENTNTVCRLSYEEAAELAFFGAKILHPMTTYPLSERKIPIKVFNTFNYRGLGTIISEKNQTNDIKGIAAKDNINLININLINIELNSKSEVNTFEKLIFEMFSKHQIRIDMSNSSRTSMVLVVKDHDYLNSIIEEISKFCNVTLVRNQTIISVVGNFILSNQKGLKMFHDLNCSDIKMIMYGASKNSISILVDEKNKMKFLRILNEKFFGIKEELINQF